jgi:large subunit ribosomal protein L25
MTERVEAEVPVVLVGEPLPVTDGEGILVQGLSTLRIECLPGDLPPHVEVNLELLTSIGDAVLVRDLQLGEGIDILSEPGEPIARVLPLEAELVEEEIVAEEVPEVELEVEEEELPEEQAEEETQPEE